MMEQPIYSVSALTKLIKGDLEAQFANLWVEGEISNVATPRSGHTYFTLKDANAQIRAVMFKFARARTRFAFENGMQILLHGAVSVYEARGEYQIIADQAEPRGAGALQAAFEQLKKLLHAEGLFDPAHKKALPLLPQKIAVVTSATGAAIRDILNVVNRRFANVQMLIVPVRVQGAEAPGEIARAIALCNQLPDIDVLIVGRGGGSLEDLWAFNEEIVARSIFASRIPVISAVGHEIDYTIADFVADVRAPTPSAAAELVVQNKVELARRIDMLTTRLQYAMTASLERRRDQMQQAVRSLADPTRRLGELQQRVDDLTHRLTTARANRLHQQRARLDLLLGKLHSLSPLALFARGYAFCRQAETLRPITQVNDVQVGANILVRVQDGELRCAVNAKITL